MNEVKKVHGSDGKKYHLSSKELIIKDFCNEKITSDYSEQNDKEQDKKREELFHFLIFYLDYKFNNCIKDKSEDDIISILSGTINNITLIEPGDIEILEDEKSDLYEIFRVFGKKDNQYMKYQIDSIFEKNTQSQFTGYAKFDDDKMIDELIRAIKEKNNKDYFTDPAITSNYNRRNLLVVTSEHDRSGTTNWILSHLHSHEDFNDVLNNKNFDNIYLLDYYRSGLDNGPEVCNLIDALDLWKKYL